MNEEIIECELERAPVRLAATRKMSRARTPAEIHSLARRHARMAIRVLVGIMRSDNVMPPARVSAANAILDRAWAQAPCLGQCSRPHNHQRISRLCRHCVQSRGVLLLRQSRVRESCEDHQAVKLQVDEIRAIVAETLAEQHRIQRESIDAIVLKAVASALASFGIEVDDRKELRVDFQHLRRWRKGVEQAQSYTFKAVITGIATGLMGAIWLCVKVVLGK